MYPIPDPAVFGKAGLIQAVDSDLREEKGLWSRCELAIFAEQRAIAAPDPASLSDAEVERLQQLTLAADEALSDLDRSRIFTPYWIQSGRRRAGIIGLSHLPNPGFATVIVWSFYLLSGYRGKGLGTAVLEHVYAAAVANGWRGFKVSSHWINQKAARYYLRRNLWLIGWKRALDFARYSYLPAYRCELDGDVARFLIRPEKQGTAQLLCTAYRRDPWLDLQIEPAAEGAAADCKLPILEALCTFSLFLALHGWPLRRSETTWADRYRFSDTGMPEGLAYKIELFEAWERKQGFAVRTPRIPGLGYRDWDELMRG